MATLTKTERVTADGAVRTASATIAWFLRSRPTGRTVIWRVDRGRRPASRARRRWRRGPRRRPSAPRACRRAPARRRGRRARSSCSMPSSAWRTRPRSVVSLTTIRAVRPAAMTLTLPPVGRSRSASIAAALAASRRFGGTSVAAMLAEVSMTRTTSRARPAGRSRNGRAASSARITTSSSWSSSSRLRRSFCHGALASTSATSRGHSSVDGTTVSSRRSLSRYIATTAGTNSRPSSASGVVNGIAASPARAGGAARRTSGRPGSCPTAGRRSSPGAWPRGRRSPPSRPRGAPCRRRCVARSTVTSMPSPVSTSTSRRSPSSGGSSSSGDRTWRTISSEPVAASSRMTLSAAGSSRSEIRTTTPRPWSCARGVPGGGDEVGRAVGRLDRRQVGEQPEDAARAAQRRPAPGDPAGERADRDPVLGGEPDVAERRRRPLREQELGRARRSPSTPRHRGGA